MNSTLAKKGEWTSFHKQTGRNKGVHFCKDTFRKGKRQVIVKEGVSGGFGEEWPPFPEKSRSHGHLFLGRMEI